MANIVFRRATRKVYVYYYDKTNREQVQIPREETEHLDGKPKEEVQAWVRQWEEDHGLARDRVKRMNLGEGDPLRKLWGRYQKNQRKYKKERRKQTEKKETEVFERYICNYFIAKHRKKDPTTWHDLVPGFHDYLGEFDLADTTISKILWTVERFGKFLVFQRLMSFPYSIMTKTVDNHKETPLKVKLTPDQVMSFALVNLSNKNKLHFSLIALLGYFGSLRPSEIYALDKADLLTGASAEKYCKTLKGFQENGLGSKLGVNVSKTIVGPKVAHLVKTHYSLGVVNIWDKDAAKLIASIVKDLPDGRLIPFSRGYLDRAWREQVKDVLNVTVHDFRRASALYLGRTLRIPLTLLQEHCRHAEIETTMLYVREVSGRDEKIVGDQDFDDVG